MMKLCWWTIFPTPNETAMLSALRSVGVDVVVCYFRKSLDGYRRMIGWRERPLEEWECRAKSVCEARRMIPDFDERIQMVPSYSDAISWSLIFWCCVHGRPWIASIERSRGGLRGWPLRRLFAFLADRTALRVFCIGNSAVEQYARLGISRKKLCWTAYAMPSVLPGRCKGSFAKPDRVHFAFVGALSRRKAVDVLAAAFKTVHASCETARLKVIGNGPLKEVFEGVAGVELTGAVAPDMVDSEILDCDVIVLPSRYDAWGVALVEGARQGLAMIASDAVGASELIGDDPKCGFVVKTGDADSLAAAMRYYAENPSMARKHGENAMLAVSVADASNLARRMSAALEGRDF